MTPKDVWHMIQEHKETIKQLETVLPILKGYAKNSVGNIISNSRSEIKNYRLSINNYTTDVGTLAKRQQELLSIAIRSAFTDAIWVYNENIFGKEFKIASISKSSYSSEYRFVLQIPYSWLKVRRTLNIEKIREEKKFVFEIRNLDRQTADGYDLYYARYIDLLPTRMGSRATKQLAPEDIEIKSGYLAATTINGIDYVVVGATENWANTALKRRIVKDVDRRLEKALDNASLST